MTPFVSPSFRPGAAGLWRAILVALFTFGLACSPAQSQTRVALTKHNLTPSGPGSVKESTPTGLCVFCHTPHNASPSLALWNRELPAQTYQLYTSSTLQAQYASPNAQPTGSSRLCLSCHDGTLAMGSLRVPPPGAPLTLGPLSGANVLGTDLRGDHPISFVYDNALVAKQHELVSPSALPSSVRLDSNQQLQCTSCHDPHQDKQPNFLRTDNRAGALCTACHNQTQWVGSAHASSGAVWNGTGTAPWPVGAYATVSDNACRNCHRSHAAGHAQRLLAQADEPSNCTICHSGTVASRDVATEFLKPSRHPIEVNTWTHDPAETPALMTRHVACADCHNPHAARTVTPAAAPNVSGDLQRVAGLNLGGTAVATANYEYEVCLKCHGLSEPTTLGIVRNSGTRNIRSKIDPANASFHPLAAPGVNTVVSDLQGSGYTTSSFIYCSSCHNNDEWTAGGNKPRGPHGSRYAPILGQQDISSDPNAESPSSYALCYQCHNRNFLITDQANTFHHQSHVTGVGASLCASCQLTGTLVQGQAPCAVCHDAHGSRQNAHLIDFMRRDVTGKVVVSPSSVQGRLEYTSLGNGHGTCYLQCHGVNHEPASY